MLGDRGQRLGDRGQCLGGRGQRLGDSCIEIFQTILVVFVGFLYFWGVLFIISTTLVWIFKHEERDEEIDGLSNVWGTYRQLYSIIKLPAVLSYVGILLTAKVKFQNSRSAIEFEYKHLLKSILTDNWLDVS
jgi:PAT family acetyl-CoA transporter-like MFS transporter 1